MRKSQQRPDQYNLFFKMCGIIGGGAVLTAVWVHSVIPVVVAGVALFCVLSFMNGLR